MSKRLYERCERIYERGGASAVNDYVEQVRPGGPWAECPGCEVEQPVTDVAGRITCLVCGWDIDPRTPRLVAKEA